MEQKGSLSTESYLQQSIRDRSYKEMVKNLIKSKFLGQVFDTNFKPIQQTIAT